MRVNAAFADLVDQDLLKDVSLADVPTGDRPTVDEGWLVNENGAWLLRRLLRTYHGSPEAFTDLSGYEAAVNGRAIYDLDLTVDGAARAPTLARRGVAFARAALYRLNADYPEHPPAVAYVFINTLDMDDEIDTVYLGSVTFVVAHDGELPYLGDVEGISDLAAVAIESGECLVPLG